MRLQRFHSVRSVLLLLAALFALPPGISMAGGDPKGASVDSLLSEPLPELFSGTSLSAKRTSVLKDSLEGVEQRDRRTQLALEYLNMPLPSRDSIVRMIDDLLNGDVDRQRMMGIRILIARHKGRRKAPFSIPYGPSPYPASSLLPNWDTKRLAPYSRRLESEKKELRLVAPEWSCGFRIPVDGPMTSP